MKKYFVTLLAAGLVIATVQAQISLTGPTYTQNFDTLAVSGNSSTVPSGWAFAENGTNANGNYTTGNGSSNSGDTYSFGAVDSSDRAFGGVLSGTLTPTIGASFTNNTSSQITKLDISYRGEQWRLGAASRTDRLDFQYSLDATSLTTGTWVDFNALDFSTPSTTGSAGARDGNASGFFTNVSSSITGLSINTGSTFWIRWNDFNATGSDDGLAIDDFSITAVPEPHEYALAFTLLLVGIVIMRRRRVMAN